MSGNHGLPCLTVLFLVEVLVPSTEPDILFHSLRAMRRGVILEFISLIVPPVITSVIMEALP